MTDSWWETFFDADYVRIWEGAEAAGDAVRQADGLWSVLGLHAGSNVLDAPCGYGRISVALAERGARVLGVDFSADMIAEAVRRRADFPVHELNYIQHDLREPLPETGFDCALNLFSSIGYGSENDDLLMMTNLRDAVRPGGQVFVETHHRDRHIARMLKNANAPTELPDGTTLEQGESFDPVAGRANAWWRWNGTGGSGEKTSSIRIYSVTELVALVEAAGLRVQSVHRGCFPEPFGSGSSPFMDRVGILAVR